MSILAGYIFLNHDLKFIVDLPGGRIKQYAFDMTPDITASTAAKKPPALRQANSYPA